MRRRSLMASLFGIILIAAVALGATLIAGRAPLLGLDLRGGVEVVLQPQHAVSDAKLGQAVDIIDRRVDGFGVSNSSVERQGQDIVIELPGIKNSQQALDVIGQTAQLYFRPVDCGDLPPYSPPAKTSAGKSSKSSAPASPAAAELTAATSSTTAASSSTTTASSSTTTASSSTTTAGSTTTTTAPAAAKTATKSKDKTASLAKVCDSASAASVASTSADADDPDNTVILPSSKSSGYGDIRWVLGPSDLAGDIVKSATAEQSTTNSTQYSVAVTLTSKGLTDFNKIAAERNAFYDAKATQQSPEALEAIELDGEVESAPAIEDATFTGPVSITGDFTQTQASDLALELNYGALPVKFTQSSVETVSALLGRDSLRAGLLAGLGGVVLVLLYMIVYYRALGLVVVLGLGVGGALLYSILTELSYTHGLTLTLEGVTGIIVSIGITVDSYVVYFERLKDEVRKGQTVRASVERGFTRAFKTVLTADLVSFMAALILYLFTVGDVRGFAFTLGLSTLLDVFTAYFFIRPIVVLLGRRRTTSETRFLGVARGLGARSTVGAR